MKSLMTGLFGAALLATTAMAADLPRKSAPVAPAFSAVPVFTWTGFYVGAHAGYGFGSTTSTGAGGFNDPDGFVGGAQIGYNHQIDRLVLGLEADLSWTDLNSRGPGIGAGASKADLNYLGTVRARVGFAVDRFMPYVTGGLAYGGSDVSIPGVGSRDTTRIGWTVGGGVEYAFTNNWTARIEGLYVDLEKDNVGTAKVGHEIGIIRAGVNYKF
ncbi:MAG: outer membrane protein [Rhabdaerophilum calidifontis]